MSDVIEKSEGDPDEHESSDSHLSPEEVQYLDKIEENPGDILSIYRLAKIYLTSDRDDQAFAILHQGAKVVREQGRLGAAADLLRELIGFRPQRAQTFVELAELYLEQGEPEVAVDYFGQAFDRCLEQEDWAACEELLRALSSADPEGVTAAMRAADLSERRGDPQAAIRILRGVATRLEDEGQRQDFLLVGERILELDPEQEETRIKVGESLIAEARAYVQYRLYDKAVGTLCRALKYTPDQVETYLTLARLLVESGRRRDAIDLAMMSARTIEDPRRRRELLVLAHELTDRPEELQKFAEQLDVDLEAEWEAPPLWDASAAVDEGLSNEVTTPSFKTDRGPTTTPGLRGPLIGSTLVWENLLSLLRLIDGQQSLSRVVLRQEGNEDVVAEFLCWRGRLLLGVRIDDVPFVDPQAQLSSSSWKLHREVTRRVWSVVEEDPLASPKPAISSTDRDVLTTVAVAALTELARRATVAPLGSVVRTIEGAPLSSLSVSAPKVLFLAAPQFCAEPPDGLQRLFRYGSSLATERWLLCQASSSEQFLPLGHRGEQTPGLRELIALSSWSPTLREYHRALKREGSPASPIALSFLFDGAAWGALVDERAVLVARAERQILGRMLNELYGLVHGEQR